MRAESRSNFSDPLRTEVTCAAAGDAAPAARVTAIAGTNRRRLIIAAEKRHERRGKRGNVPSGPHWRNGASMRPKGDKARRQTARVSRFRAPLAETGCYD